MGLISKQAVNGIIDALFQNKNSTLIASPLVWHAIKEIQNLPPVNNWIPCSERLPKETKCYLVCCAHGSAISVDFYSTTSGKWAMCGEHVAAWQPLPELYEGT